MADPLRITAEIDGNVEHGQRILSVVRAIWDRWVLRRREAEATAAAREILGIRSDESVAYRHSSSHSDFTPSAPHPDNLDALRTAASLDVYAARTRNRLRIADRSQAIDIEKSMVLLGSPTAEALSRDLFGYVPVGGLNDGLRLERAPVDLRFRWQLDPERIDPGALATRWVRGHGPATRPNWRILDELTGKPYIPQIDNSGWLATDYLLVTRLRNFVSRAAYQRGSFLVSFGGAHGTGTRAIELLLADGMALRAITERIGSDQAAFQVLLEVGQMTHRPKEGTRAHAVKVVAVEKVEDREERWEEAQRIAFPGIHTWMRRDPKDDFGPVL